MFGIVGLFLYGGVITHLWCKEDRLEQRDKINSKNNNYEFYFDKNGRMRHTTTGKKYTPKEIHNFYYPTSSNNKAKEKEEQMKAKYYSVYNSQDHKIIEIFLSREDAEEYVKNNYTESDNKYWKTIKMISEFNIKLQKDKCHLNF